MSGLSFDIRASWVCQAAKGGRSGNSGQSASTDNRLFRICAPDSIVGGPAQCEGCGMYPCHKAYGHLFLVVAVDTKQAGWLSLGCYRLGHFYIYHANLKSSSQSDQASATDSPTDCLCLQ